MRTLKRHILNDKSNISKRDRNRLLKDC